MKQINKEVEANFEAFTANWRAGHEKVVAELGKEQGRYLTSYKRLVSLQAWRSVLLESTLSERSLAFFVEAQNDALTSHVFARFGSWRSALKSLRSCLENTCVCLYYMDHPVELALWHKGSHRMEFSELYKYFLAHPALTGVDQDTTGLAILKTEYATLSRAVHASSHSFRMSVDARQTQLWAASNASLGAWATREAEVLTGLNLLLLTLFRADLGGAKHSRLRKAVSLAIHPSRHKSVREHLGVRLFVSEP